MKYEAGTFCLLYFNEGVGYINEIIRKNITTVIKTVGTGANIVMSGKTKWNIVCLCGC